MADALIVTLRCSVVIPTYNRRSTVVGCLHHLHRQDVGPAGLQIIVIDDGSTDDTTRALNASTWDFGEFIIESQANAGPGAARNRGLERAVAPIVLLINDDTLLDSSAVGVHLATHAAHPNSMVLGTFDFVPEFGQTPLGRILTETPHLFPYPLFSDGDELAADLASTCNLSVPTAAARSVGFDLRYTFAAEDVDFALALQDLGLVLRHAAGARALHDHHLTVDGLKRTALLRGFGAARLALKRGAEDSMLRDVRRASLTRPMLSAILDTAVEELRSELESSFDGAAFSLECYIALATVFQTGNLLGYLDEPALIQEAKRCSPLAVG